MCNQLRRPIGVIAVAIWPPTMPAAFGPHASFGGERYEAVARSAGHPFEAVAAQGADLRPRKPRARRRSLHGILIGRSLANNIMNFRLDPAVEQLVADKGLDWLALLGRPASETAGSGASRPASSTSWRRCRFRRWDTACGTNTASSGKPSGTAGSTEGGPLAAAAQPAERSPSGKRAKRTSLIGKRTTGPSPVVPCTRWSAMSRFH